MEEIVERSQLTDADVEAIAAQIDQRATKRAMADLERETDVNPGG